MLYDSYHVKISKIVAVLRKIFKHIVLISIVSALIVTMIVAFMATKGLIIDDSSVMSGFKMTYGEPLPLKAKAVFSSVDYEYSSDGVKWSAEMPRDVGDFKVRACANNIFGHKRYGEVYSFTINPKEIDVSVVEDEILYGELPTVEAELAFDDSISCDKVSYSDRLAKTTDVKPILDSVKITNSDGNDVTKLYKLNAVAKSINILPRDIEVTVSDQEMIYNDTKFSYDGYELSDGELATGDLLQATFDKYLIDVGEVVNTPVLRVVTSDGLDVSMHYEIESIIGKLKVNKRPLVVKAAGAEKEYDDTELINKSFEIAGDYKLVESHVANCIFHTSITNVEEKENIIAIEIKNASGEDKTPNYSLFYENGTLKITPRKINVTSPSKSGVYNATAISTADTQIAGFIDRLVEGHNVNAIWPSIIDAGSIENAVSISGIFKTVEDEFGTDTINVTQNYEIIYGTMGTLTVSKCPIKITNQSCLLDNDYDDVYYDGTEKIFANSVIEGDYPENDVFNLEFPKFSQAGKYENANKLEKVTVTSWRENGTIKTFDASENYEITEIAGTIEIGKRVYKIILLDDSKVYDGTVFTPDGKQFGYSNETLPLTNHELELAFKSTESANVGNYPLEIESFKVMFGEIDVTSNFEVSAVNRNQNNYISITPKTVTVTATSVEKVINDTTRPLIEAHELPWIEEEYKKYTVEGLNSGDSIDTIVLDQIEKTRMTSEEAKIYTSIYTNRVSSATIKDSNGQDVTGNYNIVSKDGSLKVSKIKIKIITDSVSKVYDGTPLTCRTHAGFECKCKFEPLDPILNDDIVRNESEEVVGTKFELVPDESATITDVDKKPNSALLKLNEDTAKYYNIIEEFGTLEITPRELHVEPQGATKEYDGTPLECPRYEVKASTTAEDGLLRGHYHDMHFKTITNIGKIPVEIDTNQVQIIDRYGNDVTKNYNIIIDGNAELEVTRGALIITANSKSKEYDGTPLTDDGYTSNGLLEDDYITGIIISGSQTEEGSSPNYIEGTAIITNVATGEDVTKNYDIKYNNGTLSVYKTAVASLRSNKSGNLYLKTKAYGDYEGYGVFKDAPENDATPKFSYNDYDVSFALWPAANLAARSDYNTLEISGATKYMLPYYSGFGGYNYTMPEFNTEDYTTLSTQSYYKVNYYDFCFETQYEEYENNLYWYSGIGDYTDWVKNNYLSTSGSSSSSLISAFCNYYNCTDSYYDYYYYDRIDFNGFIEELEDYFGSREKLINAVAKYVRSAATYNIHYDRELDNQRDIAYRFITNYKQGIAKHFATAGTMLYRALGIPARYVEGYFVEAKAYDTVPVKDEHAWVEVFVDGYGWMQMEVTPGFGMESGKTEITVKPKYASKEYDGTAISASDYEFVDISDELKEMFDNGDYSIVVGNYIGSQTQIGTSESRMENIKILDRYGNDVSYEFDIKTEAGTLEITEVEIDVYLYGLSKDYDGTPLAYADGFKFFSIRDAEFKNTGYTLDLKVRFENADVHKLSIADLNAMIKDYISYTVMDGTRNISERYKIRIVPIDPTVSEKEFGNYTVYEITKRQLVLEAETIITYYKEGTVLEGPGIRVVGDGLLKGHTVEGTTSGSLDEVGIADNIIDEYSVVVLDENGYDVTDKYDIETRKGVLQYIAKPK